MPVNMCGVSGDVFNIYIIRLQSFFRVLDDRLKIRIRKTNDKVGAGNLHC